MKFKLMLTSLMAVALMAGCTQQAQTNEGHEHGDQKESLMTEQGEAAQPEKMTEESTAVEVGNKICPVSKEKVGEMGEVIKYEYNGKIYNLCCSMCAKDFKKNPEKYSKIAEEEVKKSQGPEENAEHKEGDGHENHNHGK